MVKFDYTNLIRSGNKKFGFKVKEIDEYKKMALSAHKSILEDRQNNILGFYDLTEKDVSKIVNYVQNTKEDFDATVVLGIGGSALGNKALYSALKVEKGLTKDLYVLDNVDPYLLKDIMDRIDIKRTLFNVITKSGTTAETMSTFLIILDILKRELGDSYKKNIVITTDKKRGFLRPIVQAEGYASFVVPDNVGGRFSVLTDVGLVSSAFVGIDIQKLLDGAKSMRKRCENQDYWQNPAYLNGLLHYLFYIKEKRNISVMMPYSNPLYDMADWYRQLWAESLGKKYSLDKKEVFVGQTPVKALGTTDQHSQVQLYVEGPDDKVVSFVSVQDFTFDYKIPNIYADESEVNYLGDKNLSQLLNTEQIATEIALCNVSKPSCNVILPSINEHSLGEFIFMYEVQTVFMGKLLNINPLDQPGVEGGKIATYAMMGKAGFDNQRQETQNYLKQKRSIL